MNLSIAARKLLIAPALFFAALSAWAGDEAISIAPQLIVAQNGPVTVTFLGMDSASLGNQIPGLSVITSSNLNINVLGFGGSAFPTPGATTQISGLTAGSDITFSTQFQEGTNSRGELNLVDSTTGATPAVAAFLNRPGIFGSQVLLFNAGVIQTGSSGALVGFTPFATPSAFGGFTYRIALSNVCVQ
jgi:hypothetical protein